MIDLYLKEIKACTSNIFYIKNLYTIKREFLIQKNKLFKRITNSYWYVTLNFEP